MQRKISAVVMTAVLLVFAVFPAFAAEFTPSATAKPAPAVVPVNNASGDEVDAIIFDSEGNEKHSVPKGSLKLIPYSDRSSADDAVKAELESVYSSLQSADISKLNSGVEARLKQAPKTVKAENLVVRDLFNIGVDSASQIGRAHV